MFLCDVFSHDTRCTVELDIAALRAHFAERSWNDVFPEPTDTRAVRARKRKQVMELLEIKLVELDTLPSPRATCRPDDESEEAAAEVAETPANALRRPVLAGTGMGIGTGAGIGSGSGGGPGGTTGRVRGIRPRDLRRVVGDLAPDSHLRTNPMSSLYTPSTRHGREKRDSLSISLRLRRGVQSAGMTPGGTMNTVNTVSTPTTQAYTNGGTPGVFIPEVRERYIDVTGTELAMDMARDFVAGVFETSEPRSLTDSGGGIGKRSGFSPRSGTKSPRLFGFDSSEPIEQVDNHTDDPIDDTESAPQLYRIPYSAAGGESSSDAMASFLMRFPEHCLCGRVSRSGRHMAILLGSLIDKEPKEIVVMSMEGDIRVSQVVGVQKSGRYFPRSIPFNVNFFDLAETAKGDPVLLVSCAFELIDDEGGTMTGNATGRSQGDTKLHVLVRGKEAVAVESERPIIFVEAFGDGNEVLVTGTHADDGARVMKFDPLWQSFAWKREYDGVFTGRETDDDGNFENGTENDVTFVTHISKLLVVDTADDTDDTDGKATISKCKSSRTSSASIKAVLATVDNTSVDVVCTFGGGPGTIGGLGKYGVTIERIENAEVFMDGDSWRWFMLHQKRVAELGFAGGRKSSAKNGVSEADRVDPCRSITAIFASASYVAAGDVHGMVTVWDVREGGRMACKKFSIAVLEPTKVTSIMQICTGADGGQDALVVTGWSGVCLLLSLGELFADVS